MMNLQVDTKIVLGRYFDKDGNEHVITINDYQNMVKEKNQDRIADFIYGRLHSRYINPFTNEDDVFIKYYKNGFSMMANFCLLIETLESFKNGWGDSDRRSSLAFKCFFSADPNFKELKNKGKQVYDNVRCGILHQGETTGGWKITRKSSKFYDEKTNTINAFQFSEKIEKSLDNYRKQLKIAEWDSELWDNFRRKMRKIISNCEVKS